MAVGVTRQESQDLRIEEGTGSVLSEHRDDISKEISGHKEWITPHDSH